MIPIWHGTSNVQIKNLHDYIAQKNEEVSDDDDWEEWWLRLFLGLVHALHVHPPTLLQH